MDVEYFFKNGHLNDYLKIGTPFSVIKKKLGDDFGKIWYHSDNDLSLGFSCFYKEIELVFLFDKLNGISLDPLRISDMNFGNKYVINRNTTLHDFIYLLNMENIVWSFYEKYCFLHQIGIKTKEEIAIHFHLVNGIIYLNKIQKFQESR